LFLILLSRMKTPLFCYRKLPRWRKGEKSKGRSISGFDKTGFVGILFQIVAMLAGKGMR
jgi:hypothetical protein